ncbi:MAG: glycosyl hydrolase family 28-related protein [Thermomicrobiales bacterium]
MRVPLAVLAAAVASLASPAMAQYGAIPPQSAPIIAQGTSQARTLSEHLADEFKARNFGACVWDGAHDVAPCIQAAIDAASAAGGAIVHLPAGRWPIASPLTIGAPGVGLQGVGNGISRDTLNPDTFLAVTSLVWKGAAGATMLTIRPAGNQRLYKNDVLDLVLDCNGLAATCLSAASINYSTFRFGYSEPRVLGALFTTATITDTQDPQDNEISVIGRSVLYPATGVRFDGEIGSPGNFSLNSLPLLRIWHNNGDAVVFASSDNNQVGRVAVARQPGGTGRALVFGNGTTGGGASYGNRVHWFGGGTIYALGYQTGSAITAGSGNKGNGVAGALTINATATAGTYTLTATSATAFNVTTPASVAATPATLAVGSAYAGPFTVTITAGTVPFQAGDVFLVTVPVASFGNVVEQIDKANGNPRSERRGGRDDRMGHRLWRHLPAPDHVHRRLDPCGYHRADHVGGRVPAMEPRRRRRRDLSGQSARPRPHRRHRARRIPRRDR